ncbi:MAG: hypothetical protein IPJ98_30480 [Bryobacterales bacterium]|nr:hypothetical protein [Bryobacterales bacterium]
MALLAGSAAPAQSEYPDIRTVPPDLQTPPVVPGEAAAGRRVRQTIARWQDTEVHHALYLPHDWKPGGRYPVIVEYAGNGNYRNRFGDVSEGTVEGSNLGYGLSGGAGFLWLCLPYVNTRAQRNQELWWGDADATVEYAQLAVSEVCSRFGGDPRRVILAGFSRGAIACNYIGLRTDAIAALWAGFIPYSHYDGVRETWPYSDCDRASALRRLQRLRGRPQFILHENSVEETRHYLENTGVKGDFTFRTLAFRNHNDAWALRDIPERRAVRQWLSKLTAR